MKPRRQLFPSPLPPPFLPAQSPSRPPLFFLLLAVLLLLLIISAAWRTIDDSMLLLHLKIGEVILQNRRLPERDIFSVTSFTDFWVFIQWGWAIVLAKSFEFGKWAGLSALNVLCMAAAALLVIRRGLRHGGGWFESVTVAAVALGVLIPGFQPTATTAALVLWLVALLFAETYRLRPMVFLPIVTIVWANIHPAFMLPAVLPVARLALPPPPADAAPPRSPTAYLFIIILGCIIAAFVTPNSVEIVQGLVSTAAASARNTLQDWAAIATDPWTILRAIVLVIFAIVIFAGRATIYGWQILVALVLLVGCAISPVALNFLIIYLAAPAARALSRLLQTTWHTRVVRSAAATALVLFVTAVSVGAVTVSGLRTDAFGTGLRPNVFPEMAAGRLASLPLRNSILNDTDQGGYIAWRTWPLWKISADKRPTLYDAAFRQNYKKLWEGARGWEEMLTYWRVWAVLGAPDIMRNYPNNNLFYRLAESPSWVPVLWDSQSILYMKADADLSDSNLQPYRQLKPGLSWSAQASRMETPQQWRELAADLRRVTMEDPSNALAREFLKRAEAEVAKLP